MATDSINVYGLRSVQVLPSAPRSASPNDQLLFGSGVGDTDGIVVVLDLTAFATAASVTLNLLGVDQVSGKRWTIASTGALTAVGTYVLRVHPNDPTAAMSALSGGFAAQTQQGQIPDQIVLQVVHNNANSQTYSLGAH